MRAFRSLLTLAVALAGLPGAAAAATVAAPAADADVGTNNQAVQAYNENNFERAAFLFADLADNAMSEEIRLKAEYYLAQSYFKCGLYNAALRQYSYVAKAGPNHPHYLKAIEGIVNVSEVLHEDFITGALLDKEYNDEFAKLPIDVLNKINYIVGVVSYRKNKLEDAEQFLQSVPIDSAYFARARYLTAIIDTRVAARAERDEERERKLLSAIDAFNDVIGLKDSAKLSYTDLDEIKQLATLGLARVYYGMGSADPANYAEAVKQYEAIPRFSEYWDEALFENGWARFQNEDYGGSLGSLQALHAPQFAGSFQPESWILKATVYYQACLYDDAKSALEGFEKVYLPVNEKIKPLLEGDKTNEFYYGLLGNDSPLPRSVKNYLLANHRLVQFKKYIEQLNAEKGVIQNASDWKGSRLQSDLLGAIEQARDLQIQITGAFVKRRLDDAQKMIVGFDSQKEIIKFEVAKAETDMLETRYDQAGYLAKQPIYRPAMPGTEWDYWQFEGEFWLDEIGYYQYTLKAGCNKKED